MKKYTIYEIKNLNAAAGGLFFTHGNMKYQGDTLKNFTVRNVCINGEAKVYVQRKRAMKPCVPLTTWEFNTKTHRLAVIG